MTRPRNDNAETRPAGAAPAPRWKAVLKDPLQRRRYVLAALAVLALLVRGVYLVQIHSLPFFTTPVGDERAYHQSAQSIARGDLLAGKRAFYQDAFYPYFLAATYTLAGESTFVPKLLQLFVGVVACMLVFLIAEAVFGFPEAAVAGILSAVYPVFYFFEAQLLKSSLVVCFTLAMVWLLLSYRRERKSALLGYAGLAAGLSVVAQGHSYFLLPFALLWLFLVEKGQPLQAVLKKAALFAGAAALVVAPVALRNYVVSRDFVLTTYQGGTNFYIGNSPQASGVYQPLREGRELPPFEEIDAVMLAEQGAGRKLSPSEVSRYWFRQGMEFVSREPARALRLMARKAEIYLNAFEIPDVVDYYFVKDRSFLLRIPLLHFGLICPLALLGIFLAWKEKNEGAALLYFMTLGSFLSVVLFYVFARYRLQGVPFFIIFAAYAAVRLRDFIVRKQETKIFVAAPLLLALLFFCNRNLNVAAPGLGYGLMASIAMEQKDFARALPYLVKAAKENDRNPSLVMKLHKDIGECLFQMRDYDRALQEFVRILEVHEKQGVPLDEESRYAIENNIGIILRIKKEYPHARALLEDLRRRSPDRLPGRITLGTVYKKMELNDLAAREFAYVIERDSANLVAMNNLANVYRDTGKFPAAEKLYQACLALDPQNPVVRKNIERMQLMQGKEPSSSGNEIPGLDLSSYNER